MKNSFISNILLQYSPDQEVVFTPIYHSEYSIEFYKVNDKWEFEGRELIYYIIEDNPLTYNAYTNELYKADIKINFAVYMTEDDVLVIMS